jgi:hypothetical protein
LSRKIKCSRCKRLEGLEQIEDGGGVAVPSPLHSFAGSGFPGAAPSIGVTEKPFH